MRSLWHESLAIPASQLHSDTVTPRLMLSSGHLQNLRQRKLRCQPDCSGYCSGYPLRSAGTGEEARTRHSINARGYEWVQPGAKGRGRTLNQRVVGSSPTRFTKITNVYACSRGVTVSLFFRRSSVSDQCPMKWPQRLAASRCFGKGHFSGRLRRSTLCQFEPDRATRKATWRGRWESNQYVPRRVIFNE
jgi:hypothetical protein